MALRLWWAALALASGPAAAGSLDYCNGGPEPTAEVQDRLLQVAALTKHELEKTGHRVALISRSGLALQWLGHRYSHSGITLQASPNTAWSVRQLYYACDAHRPRIFDQGISGFVMGAHDLREGYVSIVWLPPQASETLERAALDDTVALGLLADTYSANAHAFSTRYQNCNQWLAEMLATAWGNLPRPVPTRSAAQEWLRSHDYVPSVFALTWQPLMWLAQSLQWLHSDDHPPQDLEAARFRVSMPQSLEAFVRQRYPDATRLELCYTHRHIVVRRGWHPLPDGCVPQTGDEVTLMP